MARYTAMADFIEGDLKKDVLDLLLRLDNAADGCVQILRKLANATEQTAIQLAKSMVGDLMEGLSAEEVVKKPYRYQMELFFYVEKQYVPLNDIHWEVISLRNLDEFIDAAGQKITMKARIVDQNNNKVDI